MFLFSSDSELDDCTSGVEGFDDFVLIITGEDESAIPIKLLDIRTEEKLDIVCGVVCLIDDNDFMF